MDVDARVYSSASVEGRMQGWDPEVDIRRMAGWSDFQNWSRFKRVVNFQE